MQDGSGGHRLGHRLLLNCAGRLLPGALRPTVGKHRTRISRQRNCIRLCVWTAGPRHTLVSILMCATSGPRNTYAWLMSRRVFRAQLPLTSTLLRTSVNSTSPATSHTHGSLGSSALGRYLIRPSGQVHPHRLSLLFPHLMSLHAPPGCLLSWVLWRWPAGHPHVCRLALNF